MEKLKQKQWWIAGLVVLAAAGILALMIRSASYMAVKDQPRIFGATYMTMNNPYFTALNESIREVVEAHGDILLTRDPAQNQERQNEQIREMIDEGMSVLFANPADWDTIGPALKACHDAGVAVIVVDTAVKDEDGLVAVIQSDQYHAGELVAEDMMRRRPDGAKIITLIHYNVHSTVERLAGFMDTIKNHPEYEIVDAADNASEIEVGNAMMKEMIVEHPEVDVVFGNNDPSAIGALAAIQGYREQTGYDHKVLVYGVDGSPDAKALIQKGEMTGTAVQYPIQMGRQAADIAYRYLNGEEIEKYTYVDVTMLNHGNLDLDNINSWQ